MNFKRYVEASDTWVDSHYIMGTSTDTITTPADIYVNDTTATVGLKGNMYQASGVSPDNPIMPQGTGERTGNLCPMIFSHTGVVDDNGGVSRQNTRLWTEMIPVSASSSYYVAVDGVASNDEVLRLNRAVQYDASGTFISRINLGANKTATFTTAANCAYIVIDIRTLSLNVNLNDTDVNTIQMNSGSTALPYDPYGYKIPILSAGQTTPIYLGEVQTTRKVKKLVLTGEETWYASNTYIGSCYVYLSNVAPDAQPYSPIVCTHADNQPGAYQYGNGRIDNNSLSLWLFDSVVTAANFKAFLAQQYANGTPVTIWYVLATEETGIVNEPLRKIGDYADTLSNVSIPVTAGANTLSVDTTLQPSEVTVNYKGWHPVADVHKRESGAWT